jgi:hypothetical protein
MSDKIDLFYFINCMTVDKKDLDLSDDELNKAYDIFMINRFLSMVEIIIPFINDINKSGWTKQSHYNFLKDVLPKQKLYIKYIKKSKKNIDESLYIAKYFEIGKRDAEMYLKFLSEKEINEIVNLYKIGNKFREV